METLNTNIATSENGNILIDFKGSKYSTPCYIVIKKNKIIATYNRKDQGEMTEGSLLGMRVRKAINQKYDNKDICSIENKEFSSAMAIISNILGNQQNGSLSDNAIILS